MAMMMSLLRPESAPPCTSAPASPNPADEDKVPMGKTKRQAALCYNVPMKILFNATRLDSTRVELSPPASPWQRFDASACNLCDTCSAIDQFELRATPWHSFFPSLSLSYSVLFLSFIRNLLAAYELLICFSEFHQKLSGSISVHCCATELWHWCHSLII